MNKKIRISNFELLRILAMLMIIVHHIVYHTIKIQLTDPVSIAKMNNALFNHPIFYKRLLILSTATPFGAIGNTIFILISGYFLVRKKKINIVDTIKKLISQQGFAIINIVLLSSILYQILKKSGILIGLVNINFFNSMSWFIGYYFFIILVAFLFLNRFLSMLNRKQYSTFLFILFASTQFVWAANFLDGIAKGLALLTLGIFFYSLGGYIRKYNPFKNIKAFVFIGIIIIAFLFIYLSYYNSTMMKIQNYIQNGSKGVFYQIVKNQSNFSITGIIIGVSLFELFRRIPIFKNRIINFLAASTFMVYLIHDNELFYSIWATQDWVTALYNNPYRFIIKLIIWSIGTFAVGVIFYSLYLGFIKLIKKSKKFVLNDDELEKIESTED